ncbi:DUF6777 domain-containing protein [Streptomyces sp. SAS_270]|uniref:DUF6777 domain-containing protein n=1 Tax=Streptomyces sp. SAS_270 TaxID=3412748 RepID=UPI00403C40BE
MSVEPPSSGRPTGPPSGPLSGPTQPSPTPPSPTQPSGRAPLGPPDGASGAGNDGGAGGSGGSGSGPSGPLGPGEPGQGAGKGPDRPWWKSAPRVALITAGLVAAVTLGIVLTRSDDSGTSAKGGEVFLQSASKSGPDPFTESTARDSSTAPQTPTATNTSESANVTRGVDGSAPGLYGGTRKVASCDVEKQINALNADPAKNRAFASVEGIQPSSVPAYLRSLTPVQLRMDTRVTNHGYRNGAPTSYQAVLQTGTAVLVDDRGVPRVRCACGNPLLPPVAQQSTPKRTGDSWPSYRPQNVVVVSPAVTVINVFVIYDPDHDDWFTRHHGDTGKHDQKTDPPAKPSPSVSVSSPTPSSATPSSPSPNSPSPCVSAPTGTPSKAPPSGSPSGAPSTCPPAPSSSSPTPSPSQSTSQPPTTGPAYPPSPPDNVSSGTTAQSASTDSGPESSGTNPGL